MTLMAYIFAAPGRVYACSAGDDFNPVAESDVIVSGVVLGWAEAGILPQGVSMKPILVDFQVDEVLKGDGVPGQINFLDTGSLANDPANVLDNQWAGTSGSCGAFAADPTGQFALLGLTRDADGNLRSSLPQVFYIGERSEFAGFRAERTAEILQSFGLTRLPEAGDGALYSPPSTGVNYSELAVATLLTALGFGGLGILRRTR